MAPPATNEADPSRKEQEPSSKDTESDKGDAMSGGNKKKREDEATTPFSNVDSTNADTHLPGQAKRHKTNDDSAEEENGKQLTKKDGEKSDDRYSENQPVVADSVNLLAGEVESLIRSGLEAYQRWEEAAREAKGLKDEIALKNKEIESLRASEESSRATIQNLLHCADSSKAEARDTSWAARVEAKMRAELNVMHSKRDEVVAHCEEYKRTTILLEEELRQVKAKLSRVAQEKIKLERDQRVTMSLAKSLDSHSHSDAEYYKRKVSELAGHVQGLNSIISEKNRQLKELQHQIERNMSQGRLASLSRDADAFFKRH